MPFFDVRTNVEIDNARKESIKRALGKAVEDIPGKSERWLMVSFSDREDSLYFAGSSDPCCIVQVSAYGNIPDRAYNPLTRDITEAIASDTDIPADRIYVSYFLTPHWGLGGENF